LLGRRRGFTLVEVIVVLVILAILAAIAIPALTGYIDKAQYSALEQQIRTQRIAFQTMINLTYSRDGGLRIYAASEAKPEDYFVRVEYNNASIKSAGYDLWGLTTAGAIEYVSLTGDTKSFQGVPTTTASDQRFSVYTDVDSGTIRAYMYIDDRYFDQTNGKTRLRAVYVADANSTDGVTVRMLQKFPGWGITDVKSGINLYKQSLNSDGTINKSERLN
jgi:prepilin-type N-terminal cleavage/methylation domain-containing protein